MLTFHMILENLIFHGKTKTKAIFIFIPDICEVNYPCKHMIVTKLDPKFCINTPTHSCLQRNNMSVTELEGMHAMRTAVCINNNTASECDFT